MVSQLSSVLEKVQRLTAERKEALLQVAQLQELVEHQQKALAEQEARATQQEARAKTAQEALQARVSAAEQARAQQEARAKAAEEALSSDTAECKRDLHAFIKQRNVVCLPLCLSVVSLTHRSVCVVISAVTAAAASASVVAGGCDGGDQRALDLLHLHGAHSGHHCAALRTQVLPAVL